MYNTIIVHWNLFQLRTCRLCISQLTPELKTKEGYSADNISRRIYVSRGRCCADFVRTLCGHSADIYLRFSAQVKYLNIYLIFKVAQENCLFVLLHEVLEHRQRLNKRCYNKKIYHATHLSFEYVDGNMASARLSIIGSWNCCINHYALLLQTRDAQLTKEQINFSI